MNMIKKNKSNGITLIALVVTIIVLLILAGISIQMLTGDNGILQRAGEAKEAQEKGKIEELLKLATLGGYDNNGALNANMIKQNILKDLPDAEILGNKFPLIVKVKGHTYRIDGDKTLVAVDLTDDEIDELVSGRGVYAKLYDIDGETVLVIDNNPDFTYNEGTLIKTYKDENQEFMASRNLVVWGQEKRDIQKVIFNGKVYPNLTRYWFQDCNKLTEIINIANLNTKYVTDMMAMFYNCNAMKDIDLSSFDASNVTQMNAMFYGCSSLKQLDLRPLYKNKCTQLGGLLYGCSSLEELYLCDFQNMNDMSYFMVNKICNTGIKKIHAEDMYTVNVTNMQGMFLECTKLEEISFISNSNQEEDTYVYSTSFSTRNVTNMSYMFQNCESLKRIDLSFFDTNKVKDMNCMFMNCKSLKKIDLSSFDTPELTVFTYLFYDCDSLEEADIGNIDTTLINGYLPPLFNNKCTSLKKLRTCDKVNWQTIQYATNLEELIISSKMTNIPDGSFGGRTSLKTIIIEDGVQSIGNSTFGGCTNLANLTIGDSVTTIGDNAFGGCSNLIDLTIGNSVITIGYNAFGGCTGLKNVTIGKNVTTIGDSAFGSCSSLTKINIPDKVTTLNRWVLGGCTSLNTVIIGKGIRTIPAGFFNSCTNLEKVYYTGTEEEWNAITIEAGGNDPLTRLTPEYNYINT